MSFNKTRTPPRPLSEATSQPDLFRTPDVSDSELHVSLRKRKQPDCNSCDSMIRAISDMQNNIQDMFRDLMTSQAEQFTQIKLDISALKKQNEDLLVSNAEIISYVSKITEEQKELSARVVNLEQKEIKSQEYVSFLEQQVEVVERKIRETSVEIRNLSTENNTQMMGSIEQIYQVLKLDFDSKDIRSAYRLPAKNNRPRPIVIEFTVLLKKTDLLQAYKKFYRSNQEGKLSSVQVGLTGDKKQIYINEFLTRKAQRLHYLAREQVKAGNWKFCWSASGKIFLRKEEGQPAIEIKSEEQIYSLDQALRRDN